MNFQVVADEVCESLEMVQYTFDALPLLDIQCVSESDLIGFIANEKKEPNRKG